MKRITIITLLCLMGICSLAQRDRQIFEFEFEGVTINGVLNIPKNQESKGLVLLVHGSGRTNAVEQEWYADIRETFVKAGFSIYMWDKMGCGNSGGTFNYNQPVDNSADEVIAAITTLKEKKVAGSDEIGLLGFSRAGWINPIVIKRYKDISFWVSVSGVDDKENWGYLLRQNLRIEGLSQDSINIIHSQWIEGTRIYHAGGSYETYINATKDLRANSFRLRFMGSSTGEVNEEEDKKRYYNGQESFMKESLDEETGLQILVEDFDEILSKVNIPVLALFGENDMNVDWKKTKRLYERTIAPNTELTIQSFPGCNHNMWLSKTGGFYEFEDNNLSYQRCDGFLAAIEVWLNERD